MLRTNQRTSRFYKPRPSRRGRLASGLPVGRWHLFADILHVGPRVLSPLPGSQPGRKSLHPPNLRPSARNDTWISMRKQKRNSFFFGKHRFSCGRPVTSLPRVLWSRDVLPVCVSLVSATRCKLSLASFLIHTATLTLLRLGVFS